MSVPLLDVQNLHVEFDTYGGTVKAVRGVDFRVEAGRTLAIVGESGCGKSVTVQAMMGLTPMPPGRITAGSARLRGEEIPLGARIMAVVDAFESMVQGRPYRKRFSVDTALKEVARYSGSQFDPRVVDVFLKLARQKNFRNLLSSVRK